MMKKWSKVGLLAAVTAFMLAVLPAYSAGGKTVAVTYDLTGGLPKSITNSDATVSAKWAAPAAEPASNGVKFEWVATKDRKVKNNSGLQFSNGTTPEEAIRLSADENITVTVTYKFAGAYSADKIRQLVVGDKEVKMEATSDKEGTYNVTSSPAQTVSIKANGMKLLKIEVAPAK